MALGEMNMTVKEFENMLLKDYLLKLFFYNKKAKRQLDVIRTQTFILHKSITKSKAKTPDELWPVGDIKKKKINKKASEKLLAISKKLWQ